MSNEKQKTHKIIDYEQLRNYNTQKNTEINDKLSNYVFTENEINSSFSSTLSIPVNADTFAGHEVSYFATKNDIEKLDKIYLKKDEFNISNLNIETSSDEEINVSVDYILGGD